MRFAELGGVTVDAFGTLLELVDPGPALDRTLRERGIARSPEAITAAVAEEAAYYRPRSLEGRDEASLARLRADCAGVFLDRLHVDVDPLEFAPAFVACLEFRLRPGAGTALEALRRLGLTLGVVANWDAGLGEHLEHLGVASRFAAVVTSAEAEVAKPDPAIFRAAIDRLAVDPARVLHVGDRPEDEQGAAAAGLRFAPAPLRAALEAWR